MNRIIVIGAGPSGLAAALEILRGRTAEVVVVEACGRTGGLCASLDHAGVTFDLGSHRLHPSAGPEVLSLVGALLGADLVRMPRNGRILLAGRFVRFPPSAVDLLIHLPPRLLAGMARDFILSPFGRSLENPPNFARAVEDGPGKTLAGAFYIPYAEKIWGLPADRISAEQARRRISASSPARLAARLLPFACRNAKAFYYPRHGFGQITDAMEKEVSRLGGRILLSSEAVSVRRKGSALEVVVRGRHEGVMECGRLLSTMPVERLARLFDPALPSDVLEAAGGLRRRGMALLFASLQAGPYLPWDAHYFPGSETAFSRMSEPTNYAGRQAGGRAGLCFEFPCSPGDGLCGSSPESLWELVSAGLRRAGLPGAWPAILHRDDIDCAYPLYEMDFRAKLDKVEEALGVWPVVSFGRQGFFMHDNFHHAVGAGLEAARCLGPGMVWDSVRWRASREAFRAGAVVD